MTDHLKLMIAGTRYWDPTELGVIHRAVDKIPPRVIVMHGAGGNVDHWAGFYAEKRGLTVEPHPALWRRYGKAAGPRRTKEMAEQAGFVLAFWDGVSKGTGYAVKLARQRNIPGIIYYTQATARVIKTWKVRI